MTIKKTKLADKEGHARVVSLAAVFLLVLTHNAAPFSPQEGGPSALPKPVDVSMVALVAEPDSYEGKLIRTHGFLCIEFEGDALYLHEEDYRHGLTENSFALRLSKLQREQFKSLTLRYVLIEGTVYAKGPEHTDGWSGAIGNISRLEAWPIDRGPSPRH
jgi:hypothetical protein